MTPIEYLTIAISAAVIVARIVIFARNPSVTTPAELKVANAPNVLWMAEYTRTKAAV
jgi:hypothetical protein